MAFADEKCYEEMIAALHTFSSKVAEECEKMEQAGNDCVDNTENDPAAEKSNAKLQMCVTRFRGTISAAQQVAVALQAQLERIREAARAAESDD